MRRTAHLVAAFLLVACGGSRPRKDRKEPGPSPITEAAPAAVAGALSGRFTTGQNGDAQYQIDIDVPPGIRGVQPQLSLTYDSQAGNGIVGMGWSLSGLSSIERCRRTPAVDGVRGTITYSASDVYCLDGQRLIAVSGGQGAAGSVYRTELETWRRVVASTQMCGSAPCSFTVTNENGAIWSYGTTAASRVAPTGLPGEVRRWAVATVADLDGNTIAFSYSQAPIAGTSAADGQLYATRIDYTSNGTTEANRSVRFTWAVRPDVMTTYQGGWPIVTRAYLTDVVTYVGDSVVKDYDLTLAAGAATGRSHVQQARVCGASGACLTPTTFTWQDTASPGFSGTGELVDLTPGGTATLPIDVNGDGRGDLVYLDSAQPMNATTYLSSGSAMTACPSPSQIPSAPSQILFGGDANGDGRTDLIQLWPNGAALNVTTYLSGATSCGFGTSISSAPTQPGGAAVPWTTTRFAMDVNGDGRTDVLLVYPSGANLQLLTLLADGTTFDGFVYGGAATIPSPSGSGMTGITTWPMDVNGDGMSDLVMAVLASGQLQLQTWLSNGAAFATPAITSTLGGGGISGTLNLWPLDINGDGLMDVVQAWKDAKSTLQLQPFPATGTGAFTTMPVTATGRSVSDFAAFWPMDATGDGQTDLVQAWDNGKGTLDLIVYRNTGSGLDGGVDTQTTMSNDVANTWPLDLDGNGKTDLLQGGKNLDFYGYLASGPAPDLISTIVDGSGGQIAITYAPLSDASVYSPAAAARALVPVGSAAPLACATTNPGSAYPVSDALAYNLTQAPAVGPSQVVGGGLMNLVKQSVESGTGYSYATSYQYGAALIDRSGRGWLGFAVTRRTDPIGRVEVDVYNQLFPYTGTQAQTLFACAPGSPDAGCQKAPGAVLSASSTCFSSLQTATGTDSSKPGVFQTLKGKTKYDYYEYGSYASSQMTAWSYDKCGEVTLGSNLGAVDASGKDLSSADNVYTCTAFWNASCATSSNPPTWLIGFQTAVKTSATSACTSFTSYDDRTDLGLQATTFSTDGRMHALTTADYDNSNDVWLKVAYTYDGYGNVLTVTRPGGYVSTNTYESAYNTYVDTTTAPANAQGVRAVQAFGYDPRFGTQAATTDANGNTNITCADELGRTNALQGPPPAGVTGSASTCLAAGVTGSEAASFAAAPVLQLQSATWTASGGGLMQTQQFLQTWPAGGGALDLRWMNTYLDGLGRAYKTVEQGPASSGNTVTCSLYDSSGNVTATSVPQFMTGDGGACTQGSGGPALWTTNTFDVYGRQTEQVTPVGPDGSGTSTTSMAYADGDTATFTYAAGAPVQYQKVFTYGWFNSDRRVLTMVLPGDGNATTTYGYDRLGRLTSAVDPATSTSPKGVANVTTYDSLGRRLTVDNPDQDTTGKPSVKAVTYGYSATDGQLISTIDAKGQKTTFVNDGLGRMTGTTYADGATVSLTYDGSSSTNGVGELTGVASVDQGGNPLYSYAYGYDPYGNLTSSASTIAGAPATYTTARTYDPPGRVRSITYPDGTALSLRYVDGNLSTVGDGTTTYATFSDYTALGSAAAMAFGNGASATLDYAPQGTLDGEVVLDGSKAKLLDYTLGWDALLHVTGVTDNLEPGGTDYSQAYGYTSGRLTSATAPGLWGNAAYGYDASGNLTSNEGVTLTYAAHRPVSGSAQGKSVYTATYDANGNLMTRVAGDANLKFGWDAANRLASVTSGVTGSPLLSGMVYDHNGKRLRKIDSSGVTSFYPDPAFVVTSVGGAVQYTKNIVVGGAPIAAVTTVASGQPATPPPGTPTPGTLYFHSDHLGSTSITTDASGKLSTRMAYRPYGAVFTPGISGPDNFLPKFQGTELDAASRLNYFQARYYDPVVGRFISPDSQLGSQLYQVDALNRFAFAVNNPVTFTDPTGHNVWQSIAGALIGALEVVAGVAIDVLSDGALESVGGALIGAGTNGIIYSATNSKNFSWKQYGIQQGMGAVMGLMTGGFGEGAEAGEAAAEEGAVSGVEDSGVAGAAGEAAGASEVAGGDAMSASTGAEASSDAVEDSSSLAGESGDADNLEEECNSFVPGTRVATPGGDVAIEELQVGDLVWSWNEAAGAREANRVSRVLVHPRDFGLIGIAVGGQVVTTTPAHPVWLPAHGWTVAARIRPGDVMVGSDGGTVVVEAMMSRPGGTSVYNIVVERAHTYYVRGDDAGPDDGHVLVHNPKGAGWCDIGGPYGRMRKNSELKTVEANHFPASASYDNTPFAKVPVGQRPAVNMDYADHLETESWGNSSSAQQWRADQTWYMNNGQFAKAMEMDIKDMKAITQASTGNRLYLANGMQEAVDFAAKPNPYLGGYSFISAADHTYLSALIWK